LACTGVVAEPKGAVLDQPTWKSFLRRSFWPGSARRKGTWLALIFVTLAGLGFQVQRMTAPPQNRVVAASCGQQSTAGKPCYAGNSLISDSLAQSANSTPQAAGVSNIKSNLSSPRGTIASGLPCHDKTMWVANITNWTAPPGCYGQIYYPDPSKYYSPTSFGYCNWWVEALHTQHPDVLMNPNYATGTTPVPGAAVWFDPNVQGASAAGHWAEVVAIHPGGYWLLITEMNFAWRGGGFGRVDYRYVHVGPLTHYIYTPGQV
jgi:hypothetical protein